MAVIPSQQVAVHAHELVSSSCVSPSAASQHVGASLSLLDLHGKRCAVTPCRLGMRPWQRLQSRHQLHKSPVQCNHAGVQVVRGRECVNHHERRIIHRVAQRGFGRLVSARRVRGMDIWFQEAVCREGRGGSAVRVVLQRAPSGATLSRPLGTPEGTRGAARNGAGMVFGRHVP